MIDELKILTLEQLIESHLNPLKMTGELQNQILQSFLLICNEKKLVEDSSGETFYPMPYQEITECIYSLDFVFNEELNSVIEGLIEPLEKLLGVDQLNNQELQLQENRQAIHQLNAYKRFVSHIQLAVCQKKFIANQTLDVILQVNELKQENNTLKSRLNSSALRIAALTAQLDKVGANLTIASQQASNALGDAQKAVYQAEQALANAVQVASTVQTVSESATDMAAKVDTALNNADQASNVARGALNEAIKARTETENTSKNIITQFVSILGVFAAIIAALFGGMSLIRGAVDLLEQTSSLMVLSLVIALLLTCFSFLLILLMNWINSIRDPNLVEKYTSHVKGLMIGLLIFSFIMGLAVYNHRQEVSNLIKIKSKEVQKTKTP